MNLSVTVPQLFYDLVARVLPGFYFLLLLNALTYDTGMTVQLFTKSGSDNVVTTFGNGLGYFFVFYLVGWLLHAFTIGSKRVETKEKFDDLAGVSDGKVPSFTEKYHFLRAKRPEAGFRLVKLRAEARMLECTRTGMCVMVVLVPVIFVLGRFDIIEVSQIEPGSWLVKFLAPLVIAIGLFILERPAWERYYGGISAIYAVTIDSEAVARGDE